MKHDQPSPEDHQQALGDFRTLLKNGGDGQHVVFPE